MYTRTSGMAFCPMQRKFMKSDMCSFGAHIRTQGDDNQVNIAPYRTWVVKQDATAA